MGFLFREETIQCSRKPLAVLAAIGTAIHGSSGWLSGRSPLKFEGEVTGALFHIGRAGVDPNNHVRVRGEVSEASWGCDVRFSCFLPFQAFRLAVIGPIGLLVGLVAGGYAGLAIAAVGALVLAGVVLQYRKEMEEASLFVRGLIGQMKL